MYLYRIHIRPGGGSASMETTFDYCRKNGVLGVGWRAPIENTTDWDNYFRVASAVHDNLNVCAYINKWVTEGDLVWTRDTHGEYYLARVTSGWEYWTTRESIENDIDIGNIFRCDMVPIPIDAVPGKVVACFRASRSIQEVGGATALEYSKNLWNEQAGKSVYSIDYNLCQDVFTLLDDQETEDAVFLYLQRQGWFVLPHSRKGDSMSFEYLVIDPKSGQPAAVQVKTGGSHIDLDHYANSSIPVFVFQNQDLYSGSENPNVTAIPVKVMKEFLSPANKCLPAVIKKKIQLVEKCRSLGEDSLVGTTQCAGV